MIMDLKVMRGLCANGNSFNILWNPQFYEMIIGHAIAENLLKAIEEVGPSNVLYIITDNASNCKAA